MMTRAVEIEDLEQFLGGCFHQDWSIDSPTWEDAVEDYLEGCRDAAFLAKLSYDLIALADKFSKNEELEEFLRYTLGCSFRPSSKGLSAADWVRHCAAKISQTLKERGVQIDM